MGKVSKDSASQIEQVEGFEGRYEEIDGYTIGFETYSMNADMRDLFKGLPDDRCQCPHWGYVQKGAIIFHFAEGSETYETGDAYYARPGHTPELTSGTEVVEFSPSEELGNTMEVVMKNMQETGS